MALLFQVTLAVVVLEIGLLGCMIICFLWITISLSYWTYGLFIHLFSLSLSLHFAFQFFLFG